MIRIQIQLQQSELDDIKVAAAAEACSVSHYIRVSALRDLHRFEENRLRPFAMGLSGKYQSGTHELSTCHDDYLEKSW